jgi:hypothetical protein
VDEIPLDPAASSFVVIIRVVSAAAAKGSPVDLLFEDEKKDLKINF